MTAAELSQDLDLALEVVEQYIEGGMPHGPGVTTVESAGWLYRAGLAPNFEMTVTTQTDVARFFAVRPDTVRKEWIKNGMPGRKGRYLLHEIAAWKSLRSKDPLVESARAAEALDLQFELKQEDLLIRRAERTIKEIRAARAEGSVYYKDELQPLIAELLVALKFNLQLIPDQMMQRFPKKQRHDLRAELETKIDDALTRTTDWLTTIPTEMDKLEVG